MGIPSEYIEPSEIGERPHRTGLSRVSYRTTLALASLAALFLWYWPVGRTFLSPITLINTFIHEYFHALAAWASDGQVSHIVVYPNASGVTHVAGGSILLIAPAGYVGSAIVGAMLMVLSHRERIIRWVLVSFALSIVLGMVLLVRGQAMPVAVASLSVAALLLGARFLPTGGAVFLAQFLAIQQCGASFQAFYWLFMASEAGGLASDAERMAQATGLPAGLWAALWCLLSAGLVYFALRHAWRATGREAPRRRSRT